MMVDCYIHVYGCIKLIFGLSGETIVNQDFECSSGTQTRALSQLCINASSACLICGLHFVLIHSDLDSDSVPGKGP